ncbi:MlaD family protein [Nocardia mexicana]|uniref:Virulence factor Mce-like protein n=1 Tax=Nocardia mexicana TaxID=279262 RepID=A0A370GPH9_9NOCA|nr:MCE family protein [Nocardia mexicana]RDI45269.1 virulence factor Mce-like protein [Nocardia mexicana]
MMIDPTGRGPSPRALVLGGVAVAAAVSAVVYLLGLRYTGHFGDDVAVTAVMTGTGDGLPEHADVKFRGMLVGRADGADIVARGERQNVRLALNADVAQSIPETVTARVVPANIFGVTAIELVDNGPAAGLRAGATIRQDTSTETTQLQTTLTTLRTVLDNIQPDKLGRVLGTLADALDPAARVPGSTIERLDQWTTTVRATPGIGELLGNLGAASAAISRSTPELVDVLAESVTAARTVIDRRAGVVALLSGAGAAVDATNSLFARNPDAGKELVSGLDETFGALAADPGAIAESVANLNVALSKLATVFNWGPSKQMNWAITVTFTPFKQYTAQDCPHYEYLYGPRCGGPSVPDSAVPQQFPPQLLPRRAEAAGPPVPGPPTPLGLTLPGIPSLPGLPALPGPPAPPGPPSADGVPAAGPVPESTAPAAAPLRGADAIAAMVGGRPTTAQLLLLAPVLADGSVTVTPSGRH